MKTSRSTAKNSLLAASLLAIVTIAFAVVTLLAIADVAKPGFWTLVLVAVSTLPVLAGIATVVPLAAGLKENRRASAADAGCNVVDFRRHRYRADRSAWITMGSCLPIIVVCLFAQLLLANDHAVQTTFFDAGFMAKTFTNVGAAFGKNVAIAVIAEIFVLVWGLALAIARMAPGAAGRPIRGSPPCTWTRFGQYRGSSSFI